MHTGRDTPSSQITEGDDGRAVGEARRLDLHPPNIPTKQSRSEIDDKFCKFEIKKLIEGTFESKRKVFERNERSEGKEFLISCSFHSFAGDETVSMVSDTWSTDVLASDSEIVEQQEKISYPPPSEQNPPILSTSTSESTPQAALDASETASEAWSTDVLASDSERLTEVDTDDTASVARWELVANFRLTRLSLIVFASRSDDTARSEIEVEARSETEAAEETSSHAAAAAPRKIGSASAHLIGQSITSISHSCLESATSAERASTGYQETSRNRDDTSSNAGGQGESGGSAYHSRNASEYVDKNANNIGSDTDYEKALREDRSVHPIDNLGIDDDRKSQAERQNSTRNHIGAAAVAPAALLLANHISLPGLSTTEKPRNSDAKPEVCSFLVFYRHCRRCALITV